MRPVQKKRGPETSSKGFRAINSGNQALQPSEVNANTHSIRKLSLWSGLGLVTQGKKLQRWGLDPGCGFLTFCASLHHRSLFGEGRPAGRSGRILPFEASFGRGSQASSEVIRVTHQWHRPQVWDA